jgi:uncharacterized protein (TIGR03086 family)
MTGFEAQARPMTQTTIPSTTAPSSSNPEATDDPRVLFTRAVRTGTEVVGAVRPEQLGWPTPCDEFDVRQLLGHLVGVLQRLARLGRGEDPFAGGDAEAPGDDWRRAWAESADEAEAAWSEPSVLARPMTLPWQQGTGAEILAGYLSELTVHTWDLATAVGEAPAWDDEVVEVALRQLAGLPAEGRLELFEAVSRKMGFEEVAIPYADPVVVPDDAPAIDRLVAWNGRRPPSACS